MFDRILEITLPPKQSAFLWGARQTGKSSYLKAHFKDATLYNLLDTHELSRLSKAPYLLRQELLSKKPKLVIIDEIQKIPALLNEVHLLIEEHQVPFILCGSSARKLKTQATNLLGGRAWVYHMYPLTYHEIPDFDLLVALKQGLIPNHYLADPKHITDHLQAYVDIYLTDEIRNEGLVRNLSAFAKFLDIVGMCNGELINTSNIARDCGVDRKSVLSYYQILVDTLLGYFLEPFTQKNKRDLITATNKFYLFDVGISNYLARQTCTALQGTVAGRSFEHFIFMELIAYRNYSRKRFDITYWRTKSGLEVDFILGEAEVAIEVKISKQVHQADLKGLIAFCEEFKKAQAIVVSQDARTRLLEVNESLSVLILPWREFLEKLWKGDLINFS